jgi:hypothetical protein
LEEAVDLSYDRLLVMMMMMMMMMMIQTSSGANPASYSKDSAIFFRRA